MTSSFPDSPASAQDARTVRRLVAVLGGAMLLLALALAALPWIANRERAAPDVSVVTIDQGPLRLADLRGKPLIVSFWSTSCAPCMQEMPSLIATQQRYAASGVRVVAVAMAQDPPDVVINFAQSRGLPYTVAIDPQGEVAQAFERVEATPTKFLIDADGNIVRKWVGFTDFDDLARRIDALLAEPARG